MSDIYLLRLNAKLRGPNAVVMSAGREHNSQGHVNTEHHGDAVHGFTPGNMTVHSLLLWL